jgi:hypothetical protein
MKTAIKAKTKLQIINETVKHYSKNPRCEVFGTCLYWRNPESQCAVGRALKNPKKHKEVQGDVYKLIDQTKDSQSLFKPEYRGHDVDFWSDLQDLHDIGAHWTGMGLSKYGKNFVNTLKNKHRKNSRPDPNLKTILCS